MWTFLWLAATTTIGWAIGQHALDVPYPVVGAIIGFVVGGIIRLLPKFALEVGDLISDIF